MALGKGLSDQQTSVCLCWPINIKYSTCYLRCSAGEFTRSTFVPHIKFLNDLPSTLSTAMVLLFADDAKCLMPIFTLQDCSFLQSDLSRLSTWCTLWNLSLNKEKCSVV